MSHSLRFSGWVLTLLFTAIGLIKPFWVDHVGIFLFPDGAVSVGIVSNTTGSTEIAGLATIPVALGCAALLFLLLDRDGDTVKKRSANRAPMRP